MNNFDNEVNKILTEVSFSDGLSNFKKGVQDIRSGVAGLAKDTAPVVNKAADVAGGILKKAANVFGVDELVKSTTGADINSLIDKGKNLISSGMKLIANSGPFNKNLKIDDIVLKSLNDVYGRTPDTTTYKSAVDLSTINTLPISISEKFYNKSLGDVKVAYIAFLQGKGIDDAMIKKIILKADMEAKQIQHDPTPLVRYAKEKDLWDNKLKLHLKSRASQDTFKDPPPTKPSSSVNDDFIFLIEKHMNKTNWIDAIDHLLKYIDIARRGWLDRSAKKEGESVKV